MLVTKKSLDVGGVVRSPQLQYELSEALADTAGVELDLRIGDLRDLAPGLLSGAAMPDVLLVEIDLDDGDEMDALGRLSAAAHLAHVPIVATASDLGPAVVRRLRRLGVADLIEQPIRRDEVRDVVRSAHHKAERRRQRGLVQGRVLAFSRATGGVGATTLAVNVAQGLAAPERKARVCLIDLDLQFGTVGLQLDLDPTPSLFDDVRARQSFEPSSFLGSLVAHGSGLSVMPSPREPLPLDAIKSSVVQALLDLARVEFDYVVVDLPCALGPWTETVLSHSDLVYLVAEPKLPAVWQLRRLLDAVEALGLDDLRVQLALNRLKGPFWTHGAQRRRAETVLGRAFDYCIAEQHDQLFDGASRSTPVLDMRRYGRLGRELRSLLERALSDLAARPPVTAASTG